MLAAIVKSLKNTAGMTLFEVAIAVLVLGILMVGALNLYGRADQQRRYTLTYDHIDKITNALSIYAESTGRTPCPGNPAATDITFGWETGITTANLNDNSGSFPVGTCTAATNVGIVPFLSLDLTDDVARDGWGRYFTYAVSPQFARSNDESHVAGGTADNANPDQGYVHARCRNEGWKGRYDSINKSVIKARYCCADQNHNQSGNAAWNTVEYLSNTDLVVQFTDGKQISPVRSDPTDGTFATGNYQFLTQTNLSTTVPIIPIQWKSTDANGAIIAPAFVLVSHGPNGAGAYLANGTVNQYNVAAESVLEAKNAPAGTTGVTFVDGPTVEKAGAAYFDDIVRWMTQDGLMAAHGALSCQYP